jgi:outer membrane murein-binding lipoprotein Lpp
MKRIALILAVAVMATGAGTAAAGTTKQSHADVAALRTQVQDLTKRVKALETSVKKLQATVKKNTEDIDTSFAFAAVLTVCQAAITADALQGTWAYVDQLFVADGKPVVFGPQTLVNDFGACAAAKTPHAIGAPPNAGEFSALITYLHG